MVNEPLLVTGASGYLGRRVIARLETLGVPHIAVTRVSAGLHCDLTDREAVWKLLKRTAAKTVIHCAARVPAGMDDFESDALAHENISMVKNLIAAVPEQVVFTSTMTVYRNPQRLPAREEDAANDLSGYPGGKRAAERLLLEAHKVRATILRLPGLFGAPRRGGLLYNAALAFAAGRQLSTPAAPPLWTVMHVDDAASMCVRAAQRTTPGSMLLNCAYPVRTSIESVLRELASLLDAPAPAVPNAPMFEMDISRLIAELGPPDGSLHERLKELAAWAQREVAAPTMNAGTHA